MEFEELFENRINNRHRKGNFFCVYLLHCLNPKFKSRIYIGFTTNPERRLQQHNKGKWSGGAKKTTCKGPWEMIAIVHPFPNKIAALAFEWAWQHPEKSRRLNNFEQRRPKESQFNYYCRALQELLSVGPWNKFALGTSWFNEKYMNLVVDRVPKHMPWQLNTEVFSLNTSLLAKQPKNIDVKRRACFYDLDKFCMLCMNNVKIEEKVICVNEKCSESFHLICLAESFLRNGELLPVEGFCPKCKNQMLWGDIIFNRHDLIDMA